MFSSFLLNGSDSLFFSLEVILKLFLDIIFSYFSWPEVIVFLLFFTRIDFKTFSGSDFFAFFVDQKWLFHFFFTGSDFKTFSGSDFFLFFFVHQQWLFFSFFSPEVILKLFLEMIFPPVCWAEVINFSLTFHRKWFFSSFLLTRSNFSLFFPWSYLCRSRASTPAESEKEWKHHLKLVPPSALFWTSLFGWKLSFHQGQLQSLAQQLLPNCNPHPQWIYLNNFCASIERKENDILNHAINLISKILFYGCLHSSKKRNSYLFLIHCNF